MRGALISGMPLHGTTLRKLKVDRDARGTFTEVLCKEWNLNIKPTQWGVVASVARVLRGMHFHLRHDEYICLLQGRCCVGMYDLRPDSPTYRRHALVELHGEQQSCLVFPRGIVHGWYFFEDSRHLQATSESYASYNPDDNLICHWSDMELGITWPDPDPILSPRAQQAGSLKELSRNLSRLEAQLTME